MRNLLLDTHIWVWSLTEPERLSRKVRAAVENPQVVKWLSPISAWEVCLLIERGRLDFGMSGPDWTRQALRAIPLREAGLTHEIAVESRRLSGVSQDPADRFIVATARLLELTLVTADREIVTSTACAVLWNR